MDTSGNKKFFFYHFLKKNFFLEGNYFRLKFEVQYTINTNDRWYNETILSNNFTVSSNSKKINIGNIFFFKKK